MYTRRLLCLILALTLNLGLPGCAPEAPSEYFPLSGADGGWRKDSSPGFVRSLGLNPEQVQEFGTYNLSIPNSQIPGYDYGLHKGAMVIKAGWIVGEWYQREDGQTYRNYLSSIGKSFAIASFGVAVSDSLNGALTTALSRSSRLYDPRWLVQGFPLSDPRKGDITFEQVFQHTSGIAPVLAASRKLVGRGYGRWTNYNDWVLGHDKAWPQTGMLYFDPGKPQQFPAGEIEGPHRFSYSDTAFAHLGLVFQNLYQQPAHKFLWDRLLEPLGFSGIEFHQPPTNREHWFTAGGLRMSTRDLARFAYFLLRGGRWGENDLLPEGWLRQFLDTPNYPNLRSNRDGFFGKQYPPDMFRLWGSGGNLVFIIPSMDLIVLRTGRVSNHLFKVLQRDFLVRAFRMMQ